MAGPNPIAVMTFGDRPTIQQDYTLVAAQALDGVQRLFPQPGSGSYLLQALQQVSAGFAKRDFDRGTLVGYVSRGAGLSLQEWLRAPFRGGWTALSRRQNVRARSRARSPYWISQ